MPVRIIVFGFIKPERSQKETGKCYDVEELKFNLQLVSSNFLVEVNVAMYLTKRIGSNAILLRHSSKTSFAPSGAHQRVEGEGPYSPGLLPFHIMKEQIFAKPPS